MATFTELALFFLSQQSHKFVVIQYNMDKKSILSSFGFHDCTYFYTPLWFNTGHHFRSYLSCFAYFLTVIISLTLLVFIFSISPLIGTHSVSSNAADSSRSLFFPFVLTLLALPFLPLPFVVMRGYFFFTRQLLLPPLFLIGSPLIDRSSPPPPPPFPPFHQDILTNFFFSFYPSPLSFPTSLEASPL